MRIEEIQIDGFGHLKGSRITLTDGLICVLGDNEAGKSTLLAFVRGILYGFTQVLSKEQRDHMGVDGRSTAAYDPVEGGNKGGSLIVVVDEQGDERRYRFTRNEVRKKDGDLIITDLTRNKEHKGEDAERLAARILAGTDAAVFGTVFALGLDELHAVTALDKDAVQGVLFAADAGIGAEIATEMEGLGKTLGEHYRPRGQKQRVNALKRELKDLDKEIRAARDEVAAHRGDQQAYEQTNAEIRALDARCDTLLKKASAAERRIEARTLLHRIEVEKERRAPYDARALPATEDRDHHATLRGRLDAAIQAEEEARERVDAQKAARARITFEPRDAEAALHLPALDPRELERVVANARNHHRLLAEEEADRSPYLPPADRAALVQLDERLANLVGRIEEVTAELQDAERRQAGAKARALDDAAEAHLRSLLHEDVGELERVKDRCLAAHREEKGRTESALGALGPEWDRDRVDGVAVDHATEAKVVTALGDAHTTSVRRIGWPALMFGITLVALGGLGVAGVLFDPVAGAVMALAGLIVAGHGLTARRRHQETDPGPVAGRAVRPYGLPPATTRDAFRGFMATLRDVRAHVEKERQAGAAVEAVSQRLQRLEMDLRETAAALDLPTDGPLVQIQARLHERLKVAQEARSTLRAETATAETRRREQAQARSARDAAQRERSSILARAGLDADAPPEAVRAALTASESRESRAQRIDALRADAEHAQRIEADLARVQEVRQVEPPTLDTLAETYRMLEASCRTALEACKEGERLDGEIETASQTLARRTATARSAAEALTELYARFGCSDGDGFAAALQAAEEVREIDGRLRAEAARLVDLEANHPDLHDELAEESAEEDAALLAGRDERLQEMRKRLEDLREEAKEAYARLKRVVDEDALTRLLQRRDAVQQEYQDAVEDWLRLGLTLKLLEKVRARYEREHGPRVLQEAGRILAHITDHRYDGIVREPDGGYVLTRPDGRRVPARPPNVSRATFAQVYLAIRLGYSEVHDGHRVPYLLDDVLSDFDDPRLERALDVLGRLALRRQVVLFTHHGHVAEKAQAAGVSVKRLDPAAVRPIVK